MVSGNIGKYQKTQKISDIFRTLCLENVKKDVDKHPVLW
jgi:hypothetical protein